MNREGFGYTEIERGGGASSRSGDNNGADYSLEVDKAFLSCGSMVVRR